MTKLTSIVTCDNYRPIYTFDWQDYTHVPHWERPGKSTQSSAHMTVQTHAENNYLSFTTKEFGDYATKQTMVTLPAKDGRKLYDWLKTVYEPAAGR